MESSIKTLKAMIRRPASKEYFEKYGLPKGTGSNLKKGHAIKKALSRHK